MKIKIYKSIPNLYQEATRQILESILKKPTMVLGLAAGNTPTPLYKNLIEYYQRKKVSFSKISTFNLDEFMGVSKEDPSSFDYYMQNFFLKHVDIKVKNIHSFNGNTEDSKKECLDYERRIQECGGIDLQIVGVGVNGHIGFNEPSSKKESRTREVILTEESKAANQYRFANQVPNTALTMGLATILEARKIILIACGKNKAEAVKHLAEGEESPLWPCSYLQSHADISCYLDTEAASLLTADHIFL